MMFDIGHLYDGIAMPSLGELCLGQKESQRFGSG